MISNEKVFERDSPGIFRFRMFIISHIMRKHPKTLSNSKIARSKHFEKTLCTLPQTNVSKLD